jgi:GNAT superfamily N-acetyltransferase
MVQLAATLPRHGCLLCLGDPWHAVAMSALAKIRACHDADRAAILAIINVAAEAYRGVIPADCWHEPYMGGDELNAEIAAGVTFWGIEQDGCLVGVMGLQQVRDVDLIRHAYVLPDRQGRGFGSLLVRHLKSVSTRRMLVGTWAAADWAVRFYQRHGFELVSPNCKAALLKAYWNIPDRQIANSVVLTGPAKTAPA